MRKLILIGRVAAGKTTLTQALLGEELHYDKTQYIHYGDAIIDTPGEYTELRQLSGPLALYAYEADLMGLVISANEPYSIFNPCITSMVNREVIGIITGIDKPDARPDRAERWLRLAGCKKIFPVSSYTGEGIEQIVAYLNEDGPAPASDYQAMMEKRRQARRQALYGLQALPEEKNAPQGEKTPAERKNKG